MDPARPVMMLRARARPQSQGRFGLWFRTGHMEDVRKIPGIIEVERGTTPDGTQIGFYSFEDGDAVQAALQSPQAAEARTGWSTWAQELEEFVVELYAPLFPIPTFESIN